MSTDLSQAIDSLYAELKVVESRSAEIKKMINNLSAMIGKQPPFQNVEVSAMFGIQALRPDQFFGKALSTAVKEYLKIRNQACTAQEIYEALLTGGFEFPKEWKEKYKLRNLTISLSKNSADFVYVKSSNAYGLWEFYPERQRDRKLTLKLKVQPENAEVAEKSEEKSNGQLTKANQ